MRVGLISHSGRAQDAIGNHLAEKLTFFLERGALVRVFLETAAELHPRLPRHTVLPGRVACEGPAWNFLNDADLVIVEYTQAYELLDFLPLLAGGKPRLVIDYHGVTPPDMWTGPNREALHHGLAQRGLICFADTVIAHSRFMKDELHRATGYPRARIICQGLVVEPAVGAKQEADSYSFRAKCKGACLLFVGRLAGNKRVPVLIEALARLGDEMPSLQAIVVGDMSDIYAEEARRCRELAQTLGVSERVHFLGQIPDDELAALYHSADALVMPSVHEGFCLPVVEAMAHGLPVIAARSTALPETVGDAGLTFAPDDTGDLATQIRRVLNRRPAASTLGTSEATKRVALVSFRFGADIVGGAERSLRTIALILHRAGYTVEVFTTCTRSESAWANDVPAGTIVEDGLVVHRFPIDAHDRPRHLETVRQILDADGRVGADMERDYLRHSIHSQALLDALAGRLGQFGAIITGPYLFGLTWEVARTFPEKTLLLPCFHDEPLARLKAWPDVYGKVGGVLYHSPEEQDLAQAVLGVNHPRAFEMGTWLQIRDHAACRLDRASERPRDLVYCGRFSEQKDVPRLLDFAERYEERHPGRFRWVFVGAGEVPLPRQPWLVNRGWLDEDRKRAAIASAAALVQLSRHESLSLVVLEAWAEGVPVVVDQGCAVLAGQVDRSGGGKAVGNFEEFAPTLDDLWQNPKAWRAKGEDGRRYAAQRYGDEAAFRDRIVNAITSLERSIAEQMKKRGLVRAEAFRRSAWRLAFGNLVEAVLDAAPRAYHEAIEVTPYQSAHEVAAGTRRILVPVLVTNRGSHPVCAEGAGRSGLCAQVLDQASRELVRPCETVSLPVLLLPGQSEAAAAPITVPEEIGRYQVRVWATRDPSSTPTNATYLDLKVTAGSAAAHRGVTAPLLEPVRAALGRADLLKRLPDDYLDVTMGRLARWKRWLKSKLLGNFKRAYVDVLSRQQSRVNQELVTAVQQLIQCCAALEHALRGLEERVDSLARRPASDSPSLTQDTLESAAARLD